MRKLALAVVLVPLLTGSVAEASYYENLWGQRLVIRTNSGSNHSYNGPDLKPYASLVGADLSDADLHAALYTIPPVCSGYVDSHCGVSLDHADLYGVDLSYADLFYADLAYTDLRYADLSNARIGYANLSDADLLYADLSNVDLSNADLDSADLSYTDLSNTDLYNTDLSDATLAHANLNNADLYGADLYGANLSYADLYGSKLYGAENLETTSGKPFYYANTWLPSDFDPVAQGWVLGLGCDFASDATCGLADINQMFQAGDLVTGVAITSSTDKFDLVDDDTLNAADITEWLAQAATFNGYSSPYLRGDTELDRDIDLGDYARLAANFDPSGTYGPYLWQHGNSDGDNNIDLTDYNALASNFQPLGYGVAAVPEPSSLVLVLAALLAAAGARCWRR